MQIVEDRAQEFVSAPLCFMELATRLLVITKIYESTGVRIDRIWPVTVFAARIECDEPLSLALTRRAKSSEIPCSGQESSKRIVSNATLIPSLINRIDYEVYVGQLMECICLHLSLHTSLMMPIPIPTTVYSLETLYLSFRNALMYLVYMNLIPYSRL